MTSERPVDTPPIPRLPDFVVIGAMKSGTTTLFRWLQQHPQVYLSGKKEPNFFSDDRVWSRGVAWYERQLVAPPDRMTGEASVSYTDPSKAETAAARMASVVPHARVIYLMRHPLDRMRSHYRHEVQRSRETRPFSDAILQENRYRDTSMYGRCLQPYLSHYPPEKVLTVRFEDLVSDGNHAWHQVLDFLGLSDLPAPQPVHEATEGKSRYSQPLIWLWKTGLLRRLRRFPAPVRRLGRAVLMSDNRSYRRLLESSSATIPSAVAAAIWDDVARLESLLGVPPFWEREP